jgi:hypothetical protein
VKVIYLDQNVVIDLAEKSEQDERFSKARDTVVKQVAASSAIFLTAKFTLLSPQQCHQRAKDVLANFSTK